MSSYPRLKPRANSDLPILQGPPITAAPQRARANTMDAVLYDEDYKSFIRLCSMDGNLPRIARKPWALSEPTKIIEAELLNDDDIRHAYFYAHYRLKLRRVSPRSATFLQTYREACAKAMARPTTANKAGLAALNEVLHSKAFLRNEPTLWEIEGQRAMRDLVKLRYIINYRDYVAEECKRFRGLATEPFRNIEGTHLFANGQNWQTVQHQMDNEESRYQSWKACGEPGGLLAEPERPTKDAIATACVELNFDLDTSLFSIKMYSERNKTCHCMVDVYIKECDWKNLAVLLYKDARQLPFVYPPGNNEKEQKLMKRAMDSIGKRYFDKLDPYQPIPSELASNLTMKRDQRLRNLLKGENQSGKQKEREYEERGTQYDRDLEDDKRAMRKEKSINLDASWDEEEDGAGLELFG